MTRRVFAPAWDGETVPVSLLYRKDTPLDGSAPLLLYGYGSYGIAIPASRPTSSASWTAVSSTPSRTFGAARTRATAGTRTESSKRRAIPSRTSLQLGITWRSGSLQARPDCGPRRLGRRHADGRGCEHGAGTVRRHNRGCSLRRRSDNHAGRYVAAHPAQMARMGNPIESAEAYRTIAAYSPYDNVRAQAYPHILATGGLTDPRVTYSGAGEMGREAARAQDGQKPAAAQDQHGGGSRRRLGPLRPAEGGRPGLCVRA